jgi:membrane protease YdiL (CAAX protease family)
MESEYPNPQTPPETSAPAPLFNRFLERGRVGNNEWWRYMLGSIIIFVLYLIFSSPFQLLVASAARKIPNLKLDEFYQNATNPKYLNIDPNLLLVLLLLCSVGGLVGIWIVVKFLHKKPFISIITSCEKIRWKKIGFAFLIWFGFSSVFLALQFVLTPEKFILSFDLKPFLLSLIIALILIPIQTGWEELLFRGYFTQGIGIKTKNAILPIISTSLIFGLMHIGNPEVKTIGFLNSIGFYILPGIIFGLITMLDEGLELAIGLHFANNFFLTLVVTHDHSAIQAHSIWRFTTISTSLDYIQLLQYPAIILIFALLYKWDFKKLYR